MGYRNEAENVMRPGHRKKRLIGFGVGIACVLLVELFVLYTNRSYCVVHGLEPGVASLLMSLSIIFSADGFAFSLLEQGNLWLLLTDLFSLWPLNLVLLVFMLLNIRSLSKYRGMEHGSAEWAGKEDRALFSNPNHTIPIADGLYIDPKNNPLKNLHELCVGDTGAGKSYRLLIPELLQMTGSYVVVDVKGSLYRQTAKLMRDEGKYRVKVLNLKEMLYSNTFNPLAYIESNEDIVKLVDAFIYNSRKEGSSVGDQIWEDTTAMLMTSIITYLLRTPAEPKTFARVLDLITSLEVVRGQILPISEYEQLMKKAEIENSYDPAVMLYKQFKQAAGETLQSVLISATSRLKLWNDEAVRILTGSDELELQTLADEPTILYVILPPSNKTYRVISSMFFSTLFTTLTNLAERRGGGKLPMLLSVLMDEFANCGKIPDMEGYITLLRSYGIRLLLIVQAHQQLEQHYEKADKTIISNCDIYNYLGSNDKDTRKDLVERLGKTTIVEESASRQVGGKNGGGNISDRGMGRELLTLDELGKLGKEKSIVFVSGFPPFYTDKFHTENHPLSAKVGIDDRDHPNFQNNAYVMEDFAELARKHKAQYEELLARAKNSRQNVPIKPTAPPDTGGTSTVRELSAQEFEEQLQPAAEEDKIKEEMEKETQLDTGLIEAMKAKNRRTRKG